MLNFLKLFEKVVNKTLPVILFWFYLRIIFSQYDQDDIVRLHVTAVLPLPLAARNG